MIVFGSSSMARLSAELTASHKFLTRAEDRGPKVEEAAVDDGDANDDKNAERDDDFIKKRVRGCISK